MSSWRRVTRADVEDAKDRLLWRANENRKRLGLIDMPEDQAQVRIAVLQSLTPEQFRAVLEAEPAEARENGIRALEAAWRRRHVLAAVGAVALSERDGRPLFMWACECGHVTGRDYFSVAEAKAGFARHAAGRPLKQGEAAPEELEAEERECAREGCDNRFVPAAGRSYQRYCSAACRAADFRSNR